MQISEQVRKAAPRAADNCKLWRLVTQPDRPDGSSVAAAAAAAAHLAAQVGASSTLGSQIDFLATIWELPVVELWPPQRQHANVDTKQKLAVIMMLVAVVVVV